MGNRLSRLVTRTGDDGTTGLGDGSRLPKDAPRIEAIGALDELNSAMGVLLALPLPESPPTRAWLIEIQHRLFDLGGELAVPGVTALEQAQVTRLEERVGQLNATLPPLQEFVLPGGNMAAATCHLARAICRRAERRCWSLRAQSPAGTPVPASLRYLNRLSDLLFVLARLYARAGGGGEVLWAHERGTVPASGGNTTS